MKGIILAGGSGSRLLPITKVVSKQLLPVYNKPMIYYPLSVLMLAGIKDILVITTPESLPLFQTLLGDGSQLGIKITYISQASPRGLADAFIVGEEFIGDSTEGVALILGDNIFYGSNFDTLLAQAPGNKGATLFLKKVDNPSAFGIAELDAALQVTSLEEKPVNPKSNLAVTGLYFYDHKVVEYAKQVSPSARGEIEITSINNMYLRDNAVSIQILDDDFLWFDTGTPENLRAASEAIYAIEKDQGCLVGCIEEIAYSKAYINLSELRGLAAAYGKTQYSLYLANK